MEPGDIVLIHGTGTIGLFSVQDAKIFGASLVILNGRKDFKLNIGKKIGADIVVNTIKEDLKSVVMKVIGDKGIDKIIETSGSTSVLSDSLELIKPSGNISIPSFFETKLSNFDINKAVLNDSINWLGWKSWILY